MKPLPEKIILAIMVIASLSGCIAPVMKPGMVYEKDNVKAYGQYPNFGKPEDGFFSDLRIDPPIASEVKVVFQDGHEADINQITEATLMQHAFYSGTFVGSMWGQISVYRLAKEISFLSFTVSKGKLVNLTTEDDCKIHPNTFVAQDGKKHLAHPVPYKDFYDTFGLPKKFNNSWTTYIISRIPCQ